MADEQNLLIEKIDQLNKHAFEIRTNDSNKAFALSKEALELAQKARYDKGLAEGLRTQGFCYMRFSKNEEALSYLKEAKLIFEKIQDICGIGYSLEGLGIVQRNFGNYPESLNLLYQGLEYSQRGNDDEQVALTWYHVGVTYKYMGDLEKALECFLKSLELSRSIHSIIGESYSLNLIGSIYNEMGDFARSMEYYDLSLGIRRRTGDKWGEAGCLDNMGYTHFKLGNHKQALEFCTMSLEMAQSVGDKKGQGNSLLHLAEIYYAKANNEEAGAYANKSLAIRTENNDKKGQAEVYVYLASMVGKKISPTESLDFLNKALALGTETKALDVLLKIHKAFYQKYKKEEQFAEALTHLELSNDIEQSIHSKRVNQKIQSLEVENRIEQARKENEIYRLRNIELAALNEETRRQKEEIERALHKLKSAQAQLIQSEKMASLGELTAGIAHEIQNPLNFVNNFSEVNTELIDELMKELAVGNRQLAEEIAADIKSNEQKINHHGKRADTIVKGMLQHSRTSSGQKELTDINALCDEYLRLAYHGLRAKDKSFNAKFEVDFDSSLPKINVIPQDIGRVVLNLINNAFYAVNERLRQPRPDSNYEPLVVIGTKNLGDKIQISVKDNGNGIPDNIKEKIFQPFFTTKPTGQGTGLGLSLSYDIIKAHGGDIKVESKEGEGTEFTIHLYHV